MILINLLLLKNVCLQRLRKVSLTIDDNKPANSSSDLDDLFDKDKQSEDDLISFSSDSELETWLPQASIPPKPLDDDDDDDMSLDELLPAKKRKRNSNVQKKRQSNNQKSRAQKPKQKANQKSTQKSTNSKQEIKS